MRLEKEVTVGASADRVWRSLSDAGTFASWLPGADLRRADDVYTGRVELGSIASPIPCEATVRMVDEDADEHVATILLHARQLGGPGIGSAVVRGRCQAEDSRTRVWLTAEVCSSGHAEPEALTSAARRVLDRATEALERDAAAAAPESATLLGTGRRGLRRRLGLLAGVILGVVLMRRLLGGRRFGW